MSFAHVAHVSDTKKTWATGDCVYSEVDVCALSAGKAHLNRQWPMSQTQKRHSNTVRSSF